MQNLAIFAKLSTFHDILRYLALFAPSGTSSRPAAGRGVGRSERRRRAAWGGGGGRAASGRGGGGEAGLEKGTRARLGGGALAPPHSYHRQVAYFIIYIYISFS